MGIKNLNSVFKKIEEFPKKNISQLRNSIIAIDFSLFIYRFMYNQNNPIECFMRQLTLFFKNNILPVYVFDGLAPDEKSEILNKRASRRTKNNEELEKLMKLKEDCPNCEEINDEISRFEKKCVKIPKEIFQNLLLLFELCGVPVIQEKYESDWILAKLSENKLVDFVLSEDSDILVFGGTKLMKKFSIIDENTYIYELGPILNDLNLSYTQFVDMCILCGCDYMPKIKNLNCSKSYELISSYGSIENITKNFEFSNINIESVNSARNIFFKEMDKDFLEFLSKKIVKRNFQFEKLENFLNNNIEKKFLINLFIKSCRKFCHYKYY